LKFGPEFDKRALSLIKFKIGSLSSVSSVRVLINLRQKIEDLVSSLEPVKSGLSYAGCNV
jgi:hypothetical protein